MDWHDWFYYDETSPTFLRWKVERRGGLHGIIQVVAPGDKAGCITVNGYAEVKLGGKSYKTHRIIYEMFTGKIYNNSDVDHIDGNRLNNSPKNLRLCDDKINSQNRVMRYDNQSGATSVNKMNNGCGRTYWLARWMRDGKEKSKSFCIEVLGDDTAYKMAVNYRQEMIALLISEGQHYTERHGKCSKQN